MGNFMKLFLAIVFNIVAVAMVINTDDIRTKIGIIIMQVLFVSYQMIPHKE